MVALRRKINFAFTVLTAAPSTDTVGVRLRDGNLRYAPWGGFAERKALENLKGLRWAKLDVYEYTLNANSKLPWVRLHAGAFVYGCLIPSDNAMGMAAYAVLDQGELVIIN